MKFKDWLLLIVLAVIFMFVVKYANADTTHQRIPGQATGWRSVYPFFVAGPKGSQVILCFSKHTGKSWEACTAPMPLEAGSFEYTCVPSGPAVPLTVQCRRNGI